MIKDRIIQVIENKGIGKENFYTEIGMTSASFRGKAKKSPINSNAIENILSVIPDVNPEWLLTGKGDMLKKGVENEKAVNEPQEKYGVDYKEMYMDAKYTIEIQKKYIESLESQLNTKRKAG